MSPPAGLRIDFGAASDAGRVREHQEDAWLVLPEHNLAIVADGMGGHRAGDVASGLAIEAVQAHFADPSAASPRGLGGFLRRLSGSEAGERLRDAVQRANGAILGAAQARPECRGMGTTFVGFHVTADRLWYAHVGDSRLYRARAGVLTRLTEDHSLVNEYLRLGVIQPEHVARFPYKNIIVRALGLSPGVEVDVAAVDLRLDDRLLLCSDGLTDLVEDDTIRLQLTLGEDPQATAERLVQLALDAGGLDNVTAVVAHARAEDGAI